MIMVGSHEVRGQYCALFKTLKEDLRVLVKRAHAMRS